MWLLGSFMGIWERCWYFPSAMDTFIGPFMHLEGYQYVRCPQHRPFLCVWPSEAPGDGASGGPFPWFPRGYLLSLPFLDTIYLMVQP